MRFGHNFWLGGPIDTRSIRLNCILQDLFRDYPIDHNWHAQIRAQIRPNTVFWARVVACQIWSSGGSLKRSCKMQFRRVGLRSIGPSSQKLWPNQIFGRFPHFNYNVKVQIGGARNAPAKVWGRNKKKLHQPSQQFSDFLIFRKA